MLTRLTYICLTEWPLNSTGSILAFEVVNQLGVYYGQPLS